MSDTDVAWIDVDSEGLSIWSRDIVKGDAGTYCGLINVTLCGVWFCAFSQGCE